MRNLLILIATVAIMIAMLAGGCAKPVPAPTPTPAPTPPKTLDIGVASPLTGLGSTYRYPYTKCNINGDR